jgi:hypothetical protein
MQLALQCAVQLALHWPVQVDMQLDMLLDDMHCDVQVPMQLPSHDAPQLPVQLKLPGFDVQVPMQLASQLVLQLGRVAVQPPMQLASRLASQAIWRLGGEHAALHPPLTTALHISLPFTTAPPQSSKTFPVQSARAELAANETVAPATRARSEDQRIMTTSSVRNYLR